MLCEEIRIALSEGALCEETVDGARVVTHCLYPSFEPVEVFVSRYDEGFRVSDGGGATHSAWLHGRTELTKVMERESARQGVSCRDGVIEGRAASVEWLRAVILAVANASAASATAALERVAVAAEHALADKIYEQLTRVIPKSNVIKNYAHRGASGKNWNYDFAGLGRYSILLVSAVAPHHVSISAKYVAFADIAANDNVKKIAVFGRKLETADVALITQVASLVPVAALPKNAQNALAS